MYDQNSPANVADDAWSDGDTPYHRRGKGPAVWSPEDVERQNQKWARRQARWDQNKELQAALKQIQRVFGEKK